jgi:predicted lipid-binding transport protein (Tim44 family)
MTPQSRLSLHRAGETKVTMLGFHFIDILLLAMVAGFLLFRLYSVLGRRTGHERPHDDLSRVPDRLAPPKDDAAPRNEQLSARKPDASLPASGPVARALLELKLADRSFDAAKFMSGARAAYEMIVTAFARGDRETLRPLLSDEVFGTFEGEIRAREERKMRVEFHFIALHSARITGAELKGRTAEITVTFDSEFTMLTYDAAGKIIEGDPKTPHTVTDIWTFARDTRAGDPNWTLVATASGG